MEDLIYESLRPERPRTSPKDFRLFHKDSRIVNDAVRPCRRLRLENLHPPGLASLSPTLWFLPPRTHALLAEILHVLLVGGPIRYAAAYYADANELAARRGGMVLLHQTNAFADHFRGAHSMPQEPVECCL